MDTCKTLISKSTSGNADRTSGSFMDSDALRLAFSQINTNTSWFGGFANLDFSGDTTLQFQRNILQDIRSICYTDGNCICKWSSCYWTDIASQWLTVLRYNPFKMSNLKCIIKFYTYTAMETVCGECNKEYSKNCSIESHCTVHNKNCFDCLQCKP